MVSWKRLKNAYTPQDLRLKISASQLERRRSWLRCDGNGEGGGADRGDQDPAEPVNRVPWRESRPNSTVGCFAGFPPGEIRACQQGL